MGRIAYLAVALPLLLCGALAGAAEPKAPPPKKEGEQAERLQTWADRIEYNTESGNFVFAGNVLLLKGDLRVDCREMQGQVDPKTRQFVKIIAIGDVTMSTVDTIKTAGDNHRPATTSDAADAWKATCHHADYDLRAGKIIMTSVEGKPRPQLHRSQGSADADTIIFYPDKGEYELIGNPVIRGEIPTGPAKPAKRTEGGPPTPPVKAKEVPKAKDKPKPKEAATPAK